MFTHHFAKGARVSHEIQRDGSIKTVLKVASNTATPPGSKPEQDLVAAIVDYMKQHPDIDRADID